MSDFYDLERAFLYHDTIMTYVEKRFPVEKYFKKINIRPYYSLSVDELSKTIYNEKRLYWVFFFFNPELDMNKFYLNRNIDEHIFIQEKLDSVYTDTLESSYGIDEIEKVFDMYTNREEDYEILIPVKEYVYNIESYVIEIGRKLINGDSSV